jgi:hypothetical protein
MAGAKVPLTFRIFKGDQLVREERLSLSVIKLGKVPSAHLKLEDETVSRMHAIIEVNGPNDVSIIDLGSTKGTFVNGQKVNKAKLQSGDSIVVGETRIELAIGASEEVAPAPVAAPSAPPQDVVASAPRPPVQPAPVAPVAAAVARPPAPMAPAPVAQPLAQPMMAAPVAPPRPMVAPPGMGMAPNFAPPPAFSQAPAGFGSPFVAATAAPMAFAQAMAHDAEIPGAQAVEVVATLGDSVVAAKHCMDPQGGKLSGLTIAMWVLGAGAFVLFALSFFLYSGNATDQADARHYWVDSLHKPLFAFREHELPWMWALFASFGLSSSIIMLFIAAWRTHGERKSPAFTIGRGHSGMLGWRQSDLPFELPMDEFPLVAPHGNDFAFNMLPEMDGEVIVNGQTTSFGDLRAQGRTTLSPIPHGAVIRARLGRNNFVVRSVPRPRDFSWGLFALLRAWVAYIIVVGGASAIAGAFVFLMFLTSESSSSVGIDLASLEDLSTRTASNANDDPPPPPEEDKPDDGKDESGGTGTAMALDEGKMGKKDSDRAEGQYKMKNENVDPQLARQQAVEQARNAGFLGSTALQQGGAFASLTGTGDISSGFDDSNIYGGLLGNEAGEMNGGFGYGRSGFGPGGGGTGWGTIGTGRYGTIGHGSGTGNGYGVGGGRGGMRGRTAAVPSVSIGQPSANGDLDKAIIRRYIKRNIQKITYCYEKQLLAKPGLAGTVSTSFFITPNGTVQNSAGQGVDPEVATCVAGVISGIEFPKPKGGGGVQVNYPFTFRPAGS